MGIVKPEDFGPESNIPTGRGNFIVEREYSLYLFYFSDNIFYKPSILLNPYDKIF